MSAFDLDERGADEIDAKAATEGVPFMPGAPSIFQGTPTATVKGLARGTVGKTAVLLGDAITPVLKPTAKAIDQTVGTSLDKWLDDQQRLTRQSLEDLKPDPHTTGFAAQVLGGFADIGSSAVLFTPEGAAILEGYARKQELEGQGVGPNVAAAGGAVSGVATLVGVKAPMTLGRVAAGQGAASMVKNMGFGAAANVSAGVAERGTLRELLERSGFKDQAAMFDPYDQQAMLAESALGALFSGNATALELRHTPRGQQIIDSALTTLSSFRRLVRVAPGVPTDARSSAAHSQALDVAAAQMLRNEQVNVGEKLADTTFVRPAERHVQDIQDELRRHVADLLPERSFAALTDAPPGIRSNNPGNIRKTSENWQGQVNSDGGFVAFESPQAGVRALAKTLLTYQDRHGLNTVEGIIGRWAPPKENNTTVYVRAVADAIGVEPTTPLDLRNHQVLESLTRAIIHHENGQQPYPDAILRAGVDMALGRVEPMAATSSRLLADQARSTDVVTPAEETLAAGRPEGSSPAAASDLADAPTGLFKAPDLGKVSAPEVPALAPSRAPRASELEPIAVGPDVVKPREIATGQPLYRETSLQGLGDLLMDDHRPHVRQMFVTDNRDLAIGQGENKGVHVVYREGALSGSEHRKPGTGDTTGREYRTDIVAPKAIESFTVPAGFKPQELRGLARRALADFNAQPQADGSIRYTRKSNAPVTESNIGAASDAAGSIPARGTQAGATATGTHDAAVPPNQAVDPAVTAAAEVAALRPDMLVAMEDGTELPASEVLARAEAERVQAEQDARAFQAAAHCFLRS